MTNQELIDYYVNLLIVQYSNKPNARATIEAFVREAIADQVVLQVENAFSITTTPGIQTGGAVGVQLDAIGTYRGASRYNYGVNLDRSYFTMPFYGESGADEAAGFAVYGEDPITWFFLTYQDSNQPIYTLNDDELTRLIQFRAQAQSQFESIQTIDDLMFSFFGNNAGFFDNMDMSMTYVDLISDPDTLFGILAITNSFPKPAGVRINIIRSETLTEFFGFQRYGAAIDPIFVGYGLYGTPQTGSFVRYG